MLGNHCKFITMVRKLLAAAEQRRDSLLVLVAYQSLHGAVHIIKELCKGHSMAINMHAVEH